MRSADFDFLADHAGPRYVRGGVRLLAAGPLPREGGPVLAAATATPGGIETVGDIPACDQFLMSPEWRWIGVPAGEMVELYDLHEGCRRYFCFMPTGPFSTRRLAVHPSGEMMAERVDDRIDVLLADGEVMASARFPLLGELREFEHMLFSAHGDYLWFVHYPNSAGRLVLLEWPTLKELDSIEMPSTRTHWPTAECEPVVNPFDDAIYLNEYSGDHLACLSFHTVHHDPKPRLVTMYPLITEESTRHYDDRFEGDQICEFAFCPGGERFAGFDRNGSVYVWDSDCVARQAAHYLDAYTHTHGFPEAIAYALESTLMIQMEETDDAREIRAMTARPLGAALWFPREKVFGRLLPNGMFLSPAGEGRVTVNRFVTRDKPLEVVAGLDPAHGVARKVYRRWGRGWREITGDVAWVEPRVQFEPAE